MYRACTWEQRLNKEGVVQGYAGGESDGAIQAAVVRRSGLVGCLLRVRGVGAAAGGQPDPGAVSARRRAVGDLGRRFSRHHPQMGRCRRVTHPRQSFRPRRRRLHLRYPNRYITDIVEQK